MRRFITSLTGKVISQLVVLALLLPSITLILANKSFAQVAVQPLLAVVEFQNDKTPGTAFGKLAADAVTSEFTKLNQYDVLPGEYVAKAIQTLGIASPPQGHVNLFRVAQEVRASYIVTGEISDYRIVSDATGRHAVVALSVTVYDAASEVALNGSSVSAQSTSRAANVDEATLINDAVTTGAELAVREIHDRSLPSATVLNTQVQTALINQGSRAGFQEGQHVIITRGRREVATAVIADVEPDSSTVQLQRSFVGIQPGDKVHVIFEVPPVVGIDSLGNVHNARPKRSVASNSSIVSALLVVGLVVALLSNGNSNATDATSQVTAEALLEDGTSGLPAVRVSWYPSVFYKGNGQRYLWIIWRSDQPQGPVLVADGNSTNIDDMIQTPPYTAVSYGTAPLNGTACVSYTGVSYTPTAALTPGRPYTYQVQLLYALTQLDLPGNSTGGSTSTGTTSTGTTSTGTTSTGTTSTGTTSTGTTSTGTTSTGTTSTGTTSTGTTSTGTTSGGTSNVCYFLSTTTSSGYATPLYPATLLTPAITLGSLGYPFRSVVLGYPITIQYVLQFSTDPTFPNSSTYTAGTLVTNSPAGAGLTIPANVWPASTESTSAPSYIQNAASLWWRIGARDVIDSPGPLPTGANSSRYVFSQPQQIQKPSTPPSAPAHRPTRIRKG